MINRRMITISKNIPRHLEVCYEYSSAICIPGKDEERRESGKKLIITKKKKKEGKRKERKGK